MKANQRFSFIRLSNKSKRKFKWKDLQDVGKRKDKWDGNGKENALEKKKEKEN